MWIRIVALAAFLSLIQTASFAEDTTENIGDWLLTRSTDENNPISLTCRLDSGKRGNEARMRLVNRLDTSAAGPTRGSAYFNFDLPERVFDKRRNVDAVVVIPGHGEWKSSATWIPRKTDGRLALVADPSIDSVVQPLAKGSEVEIRLGDKVYAIGLQGSYKAMVRYEACLADVTWITSDAVAD